MKFISKFDRYITALYLFTIAAVIFTAYFTFKEVINRYNQNQHKAIIPLFSIVNSEIVRPLNVAYFLANDPLLIDYVESETIDRVELLRYLKRLDNRYDLTTFIALEQHAFMLDSTGKEISLVHDKAEWYHRLKALDKEQFADIGNADDPHLYFDMKLFNNQEKFLGFVGVAVDLNHFAVKFAEYQERFGFELVFVDEHNQVTLSSNHLMKTESHHRENEITNISELDWYQQLLAKGDNYQLSNTVVVVDDGERVISQTPIQSLNWRMFIISPPAASTGEYWQLFLTRIGLFFLVVLVLFFFFISLVDYFKHRLVEDSETDFLTKLPNRSFLNWKYEELACNHLSICAVIGDIDRFKQINDKYGHIVGDEVLKDIAAQINDNLRRDDISGRWGGEEFVLFLPDTLATQAIDVVERIRRNIAEKEFSVSSSNECFNITISFGIAVCPSNSISIDEHINKADKALYRAKSLGRNRTEIYQEE